MFMRYDRPPLAPTLPPMGAGAHCDAAELPTKFSTVEYRLYGTIAIGGCHSGGGSAPESVIISIK